MKTFILVGETVVTLFQHAGWSGDLDFEETLEQFLNKYI